MLTSYKDFALFIAQNFLIRQSKYGHPSLFADLLSVNSLIHMDKIGKMQIFKSKIDFSIRGPKCQNISTANYKGNL